MKKRTAAVMADYNGISPKFPGEGISIGEGAAILGRAEIGSNASLGTLAVIRADGHKVNIGDNVFIGNCSTVHIAHELIPAIVGNNVTIGSSAVIHACTVGDGCVVDCGAVILDGSGIGPGAVIGANSTVFPRSRLEGGWLYEGNPARPVSKISSEYLKTLHGRIRREKALPSPDIISGCQVPADSFVAPTASLKGDIQIGGKAGIFYSCMLDAGKYAIKIGDGTNVQDNSLLACKAGNIIIEDNVTVGHNVIMDDCHIESGCLVGIGSRVASGTIIEGDVLLAAGSETMEGQRLSAEQVWAGRPARPIAKLDDGKFKMMSDNIATYIEYAEQLREAPHTPFQ
ncbi:MAG: gamma carbonic anhydrase family protein [Roseovarius sp.]|nr:gamma carbonic anhydrase family protein [Roseovarius sp.]